MLDVFISYAHEDRQVAVSLAAKLHEENWNVFLDRGIEPGAEWNEVIQQALRDARCVLVLWSAASRSSLWVQGEAADSFARNTYVPVRIDKTEPPKLFRHVQAKSIAKWVEQQDTDELNSLKSAIASRIGGRPMYEILEPVADGAPVTNAHSSLNTQLLAS